MEERLPKGKRVFWYISKRVLEFVVVLFFAITVNFFIQRLVPGNPIGGLVAAMEARGTYVEGAQEIVQMYKKMFALDKPIQEQYIAYLWRLLHGDLGISIVAFPSQVSTIIFRALPWSIGLLATSTIISWVGGNFLGLIAGWRRESKIGNTLCGIALVVNQIPYYFLALVLIFIFAYLFPILPTRGGYALLLKPSFDLEFILSVMKHAILPSLSIVLIAICSWTIGMRQLIVSIKGEDYLFFAKAKGLKGRDIMMKYAFRNALLPTTTGLAMSLGFIVSGSLITEYMFAYPGIGTVFVYSVQSLDYNLAQGVFLITTVSVLAANLLIEFLYPLIDPRIAE